MTSGPRLGRVDDRAQHLSLRFHGKSTGWETSYAESRGRRCTVRSVSVSRCHLLTAAGNHRDHFVGVMWRMIRVVWRTSRSLRVCLVLDSSLRSDRACRRSPTNSAKSSKGEMMALAEQSLLGHPDRCRRSDRRPTGIRFRE